MELIPIQFILIFEKNFARVDGSAAGANGENEYEMKIACQKSRNCRKCRENDN